MQSDMRYHATITGIVQGVGFRPFIHRLATAESLSGWVCNSGSSVDLEVEGSTEEIESFFRRMEAERPPHALLERIERKPVPPRGDAEFRIQESEGTVVDGSVLTPDLAVCKNCLSEVFDPGNRRYLYPFTTCTLCGPRYTIAESVPFDRQRTSMRDFVMCDACLEEYRSQESRRFHSQTNCCAACGPMLELRSPSGSVFERSDAAFIRAAQAIDAGQVVAVKGVGGFHLFVDGTNEEAVARLREKKHRETKPLALLMTEIAEVERYCVVSPTERELLVSPAAPIVLLAKRDGGLPIATNVAPGVGLLGVMIAYTPLHHFLLRHLGRPLVATSANLSDDPICFDESDLLDRMGSVADLFLVYNRRIVRAVDDSVVREIGGRGVVLRRGRGLTPGTMKLPQSPGQSDVLPILACGGHLKNAIALSLRSKAYLSPHIGTLDSGAAIERYHREVSDLVSSREPAVAACDLHPDYASTAFAMESGSKVFGVQHHYAHVLSCLADNAVSPPVLGVAWDGSGYGTDRTLWGGEFLELSSDYSYHRMAFLRRFPLPGGEKAVKEPRRATLGLLYEMLGDDVFKDPSRAIQLGLDLGEIKPLRTMLARHINSPVCSSIGRLFDAVAALIGVRQKCDFEGQAAMELETLAWKAEGGIGDVGAYPMHVAKSANGFELDWGPMIGAILNDLDHDVSFPQISARFHRALAKGIVAIAEVSGQKTVVLTGGVFQNKYLCEAAIGELERAGFQPVWHKHVPPNDGGLAVGQLVAASFGGR